MCFSLSNSHKCYEAEIALRALEEGYHINANNRRFDKKNSRIQVHRTTLSKWTAWGSRLLSFKINQKMWAREWILWNYLRLNCSSVFLMLSCNSHPENQTDPPETSEVISPLSLLPAPNKDTGVTSPVHTHSPSSCSALVRSIWKECSGCCSF